jgi:hypothetical protein
LGGYVRALSAKVLLQALKTRIACEPPWKTACSLVSSYFQRSLLEDFYRRQNDIIDSLMEVRTTPVHLSVLAGVFADQVYP